MLLAADRQGGLGCIGVAGEMPADESIGQRAGHVNRAAAQGEAARGDGLFVAHRADQDPHELALSRALMNGSTEAVDVTALPRFAYPGGR